MAEGRPAQMMRENRQELDNSLENGEENEEEEEKEPGYTEERFRVDRRKLEQMIQGEFTRSTFLTISFRS